MRLPVYVREHPIDMGSFTNEVTPLAPTKSNTRGSRLGSLYYSSTSLTMDLPAALACDIYVVVEGAPVAVVDGACKDGLAVGESVLSFILVMTQIAKGPAQGPSRRNNFHTNEGFHRRMRIHSAGDWARKRAGGGAEVLQRSTALQSSIVSRSSARLRIRQWTTSLRANGT